jgi:hypothetical protein
MNKWLLYRINRYPFLDGDNGAGNGGGAGDPLPEGGKGAGAAEGKEGDKAKGKEGDKTFTQGELDAILDKKFAKWQKDTDAKVAAAKTEAEKLANMSADDRAKHEREQADARLQQREAEITRRQLRAQALEILGEKSLPRELAEVLDYSGQEKCSASIGAVEKAFRAAMEKAVNEKLKGNPPPAGGGVSDAQEASMRAALGLPQR